MWTWNTPSTRSTPSKLGVDVDNLFISQPTTGEEALDIMDALIRSSAIDIVVLDSVAALVPKSELEGDMGDSHMGVHARLMSQALRKVAGSINRTNTAAIFINQIAPEDRRDVRQPGDHERRHGAEVLRQRPHGSAPHRDRQERHRCGRSARQGQDRQEQGRAALPAGRVRHHVRQGHQPFGQSCWTWAWTWASSTRAGAYFSFGDIRLGQGRENARAFLEDNEPLMDEIEGRIRNKGADVPIVNLAEVEEEDEDEV